MSTSVPPGDFFPQIVPVLLSNFLLLLALSDAVEFVAVCVCYCSISCCLLLLNLLLCVCYCSFSCCLLLFNLLLCVCYCSISCCLLSFNLLPLLSVFANLCLIYSNIFSLFYCCSVLTGWGAQSWTVFCGPAAVAVGGCERKD